MSARNSMTLQGVSFAYDGGEELFSGLDLDLHRGFTGCVGANGSGKTTLLRLALGELRPTRGQVLGGGAKCYCPQRTDDPPVDFAAFMSAADAEACVLQGKLAIDPSWSEPARWSTLSHGERKRCQIGTALWLGPEVLAIDEPTNHIDAAARALLVDALRGFRGIGLLVSHDRDLLDALCSHCVWIDPPEVALHRGGFSEASERREHQDERNRRDYEQAHTESKRIEREVHRRREEAARSHRKRSKRGLDLKDHDSRFKRNKARVSGKDGAAGRQYRQLLGRGDQVEQRLAGISVRKQHDQGIWLDGARSRRDLVIDLPAGQLPMGERTLHFGPLSMTPTARVAITGQNGAGKSTLVHHICAQLDLPPDALLFVPQEVGAEAASELLREAKSLPGDRLGRVMTTISRLNSRPQRLLESACPSPGELRKLLLALGMARSPHLLVLDEPTNHLDLPSIESLESALAECPCALLLVSHDERFLSMLARERWPIERDRDGDFHVGAAEVIERQT